MVKKKFITGIVISVLITVFVLVAIFVLNHIGVYEKHVASNEVINLNDSGKNIKCIGG